MEDRDPEQDPEPNKLIRDPDENPGGPKLYGSGSGCGYWFRRTDANHK